MQDPKVGAWRETRDTVAAIEAIVGLLRPHAEAVLHDLDHDRVLGIWNPISGRRIGSKSYLDQRLVEEYSTGKSLGHTSRSEGTDAGSPL